MKPWYPSVMIVGTYRQSFILFIFYEHVHSSVLSRGTCNLYINGILLWYHVNTHTGRDEKPWGFQTQVKIILLRTILQDAWRLWNPFHIVLFPLSYTRRHKTLNAELNPIRHLLALVGARHFVHVSRIRVKYKRSVLSGIHGCYLKIISRDYRFL